MRSRLQALSCQYKARCGAQTHKPRDHDLSRSEMLNRLSHPGAPWILTQKARHARQVTGWSGGCTYVTRSHCSKRAPEESREASRPPWHQTGSQQTRRPGDGGAGDAHTAP